MAKGRKPGSTSASSATRKKQAAHAAKKADKRSRDLEALTTLDEALSGGAPDTSGAASPARESAQEDAAALTSQAPDSPSADQDPAKAMGKGQLQDKTQAKEGKAAHLSKRQKREAKAKNKQYVPPVKVQGVLDPLDTLGLAQQLPADLVLLLRKAGKKDIITRQRALEGLKDYFEYGLAHVDDENAAEDYASALVLMLPSWIHIFPRLAVSPARRLRQLSAQIQGLLALSEVTGPDLLGTPEYTEAILGSWALLAFDTEASVATSALPSFERHVYFSGAPSSSASVQLVEDLGREFFTHLRRAIVSPLDVFTSQVDAPPSGASTPLRDAKNRDEAVEESIEGTCSRIVAAALGSLSWSVAKDPDFGQDESVTALFASDELWECFHPPSATHRPTPTEALAGSSPQLRGRAWSLLGALRSHHPSVVQNALGLTDAPKPSADAEEDDDESPTSRLVRLLKDAWSEHDASPFRLMLEAVVPLLREFPQAWSISPEEVEPDDEEEDEVPEAALANPDNPASAIIDSPVWKRFVSWVRAACGGQPTRGGPTLVLFVSTLPSTAWSPTSPAALHLRQTLFDAFAYALDPINVALDNASRKALIEGECEVIIFITRQILQYASDDSQANFCAAEQLVHSSLGKLWKDMLLSDTVSPSRTGPAAAARQRQNHAWLIQQSVKVLRGLAPKPGAALTADLLPAFLSHSVKSAAEAVRAGEATNLDAIVEIIAVLADRAPAGAPDTTGAAATALSDMADLATNDLLQLDVGQSDVSSADGRFQLLNTLVAGLPRNIISSPEAAHLLHRLTLAAEAGIELALLRPAEGAAPGASVEVAMQFIASLLPKLAATTEPPTSLTSFWSKLLGAIARLPELKAQVAALAPLSRLGPEVEAKLLPADDDARREEVLAPLDNPVNELAGQLFNGSTDHGSEATVLLLRLVRKPLPFVEPQLAQQVLVQAVTWAESDLRDLIAGANDGQFVDRRLSLAQKILAAGDPAEVATAAAVADLFPTAFVGAHCLDPSRAPSHATEVARQVWAIAFALPAEMQANLTEQAAAKLAPLVSDPSSAPLDVLQGAVEHLTKSSSPAPTSEVLLPVLDELTVLSVSLGAPQAELAQVDALIPSVLNREAAPPSDQDEKYDDMGLSAYARAALFSLRASEGDEEAQLYPELLIHWLYLALLAEDALVSPRAAKGVFHPASQDVTTAILSHVVHVLSSTVAAASRGGAADGVLAAVQEVVKGNEPNASTPLALAAVQLASDALAGDANATRSLQRLITGIIRFGLPSQFTLEKGLRWAHDLSVKGQPLGVAVARALVLEMGEDKLVERLQTDAVVRLASVTAEDAAVQGAQLLTYILATSPGPDEPEPITSHRAIMALKALERWYASEEDLPDALAGQIAALGTRFLPVIQTVSGSHWEFLVDAAEMALEMAAERPKDPASWPAATAAATFFGSLLTFAATNQILAETWNERRGGVYGLVVGFVLALAPSVQESETSLPPAASPVEEALWDALLPLAAAIPDKAFDTAVETANRTATVQQDLLSLLLAGPSPAVQLFAFRRLSTIVKSHTEDEVVRLAMEAEAAAAVQESVQRETVQEELDTKGKDEPAQGDNQDAGSEASFASATPDPNTSKADDLPHGSEHAHSEEGPEDASSEASEPEPVPSPPSDDKAPNFLAGLVEALSIRSLPVGSDPDEPPTEQVDRRQAWGTLLGWLLLMDHFDGASLPLATALLDRLRRARAVETALMPLTFDTLLPELQDKVLELDLWGIDEVYLDFIDVTDPSSLSVLAAHVYLRALATVPALVRSWWMGLRDRALTSAVERFTVRFCTPILAGWEMAEVQAATSTPAAGGALGISGLGVRAAGTHEAVASYTVDEETLEVRVRLPRNFPLTPVTIGDGGRNPPAVPVAQWRAWMLATQQLVANRNAPLLDAVALFGRNAEARFAGFEGQECAICYSILNPTDHSLPSKPCKTCKNKFHGQCLYKWVTTSGNSTCPLCRSML